MVLDSCSRCVRHATDALLQVFGVPRPLHRDLRGCVLDRAEVIRSKFDVGGGDVLLETVQLRGTGNGHDPRLLREEPGEGDLRRRRFLLRSNAAQQFDHTLIGLPIL